MSHLVLELGPLQPPGSHSMQMRPCAHAPIAAEPPPPLTATISSHTMAEQEPAVTRLSNVVAHDNRAGASSSNPAQFELLSFVNKLAALKVALVLNMDRTVDGGARGRVSEVSVASAGG